PRRGDGADRHGRRSDLRRQRLRSGGPGRVSRRLRPHRAARAAGRARRPQPLARLRFGCRRPPARSRMKPYLSIEDLGITFTSKNGAFTALQDVNLRIERGEYVALIGHSGCGKSTLLNIVAGLLRATSGVVLLDDREVNAPGPDRAVVFQNHSLLP